MLSFTSARQTAAVMGLVEEIRASEPKAYVVPSSGQNNRNRRRGVGVTRKAGSKRKKGRKK